MESQIRLFLHVMQHDNYRCQYIALIFHENGTKYFVDSSQKYFITATENNFCRLGYKSIIEASRITWNANTKKGKRIHNKSIYCEGSDSDGSSDEVKNKTPLKACDSIS